MNEGRVRAYTAAAIIAVVGLSWVGFILVGP